MSLHYAPRLLILARSVQFLAGGFGLGLLGGLFVTEAAFELATPIGIVAVGLFAVASFVQVILMLSEA